MRVLGAVLAGGASRRFGTDKALAEVDGAPMIARILAALAPQVEAVAVCGRTLTGIVSLPDRPAPGMGPLGGLAAALHHGHAGGFDAVLSVPCDTPELPLDLCARLAPHAPAYLASLPVIGLWPSTLADRADAQLATGRRSMRGWAERCGATSIDWPVPLPNINTPAELAAWQQGR